MVLNLMILKMLVFLPGRLCVKKGLPWLEKYNTTVITINKGESTTNPVAAARKSKIGFTRDLYIEIFL
jgi:hypothetical protein